MENLWKLEDVSLTFYPFSSRIFCSCPDTRRPNIASCKNRPRTGFMVVFDRIQVKRNTTEQGDEDEEF